MTETKKKTVVTEKKSTSPDNEITRTTTASGNTDPSSTTRNLVSTTKTDDAPEAPPSNAPDKVDPPAANLPKAHTSNSTDVVEKTNMSEEQVENAAIDPNANPATRTVVTHANDASTEVVKPSPNKSFPLNSPPGAGGATASGNNAAVPVPQSRDPSPSKEAIEQAKKIEEEHNRKTEEAVKKSEHHHTKKKHSK